MLFKQNFYYNILFFQKKKSRSRNWNMMNKKELFPVLQIKEVQISLIDIIIVLQSL